MALIADILLIAGALGAAFYCVVLSRRLSNFSNLESGVGAAIADLSTKVTDLTTTLETAQNAATASSSSLERTTERAEDASRRLELLMASLHDIPLAQKEPQSKPPVSGSTPRPTFLRSPKAAMRQET